MKHYFESRILFLVPQNLSVVSVLEKHKLRAKQKVEKKFAKLKSVVIQVCNLMKVKEILKDLMAEKEVSEEKEEDAALIPSYEGNNQQRNFINF